MTALEKIAFYLNRRDEVPNVELAHQLAAKQDKAGIAEIAENLTNKNKAVCSDCLKVLYEIGYLKPELISPYVKEFLSLLVSKDNRKVWGGMIALATISDLKSGEISNQIDMVIEAFRTGSLITRVWGVRVFAKTLSGNPTLATKINPILKENLQSCLARDIPIHLESMLPISSLVNSSEYQEIVERREKEMTPSQVSRLKKVQKKWELLNQI